MKFFKQVFIFTVWTKITAAASNLGQAVKDITLKVLKEFQPKIMGALDNFKKIIVDGVTNVVIEVCGSFVKIVSEGQVATSDGSYCPSRIQASEIYVEIMDSRPSPIFFTDRKF